MTSPGPWKWTDDMSALKGADGHALLVPAPGWEAGDESIEVSRDDARLIAAAPRMLELLRRASEQGCDDFPPGWLMEVRDLLEESELDK